MITKEEMRDIEEHHMREMKRSRSPDEIAFHALMAKTSPTFLSWLDHTVEKLDDPADAVRAATEASARNLAIAVVHALGGQNAADVSVQTEVLEDFIEGFEAAIAANVRVYTEETKHDDEV